MDTANNTKQLLLELKSLAQQTVKNFGCKFDPKGQDFTNRFLKGFGKVRASLLNLAGSRSNISRKRVPFHFPLEYNSSFLPCATQ